MGKEREREGEGEGGREPEREESKGECEGGESRSEGGRGVHERRPIFLGFIRAVRQHIPHRSVAQPRPHQYPRPSRPSPSQGYGSKVRGFCFGL